MGLGRDPHTPQGVPAITSLRLLLLAAAIVEINVLGRHLQAPRDHGHCRDELAVLRHHQLLPLVLLLGLSPAWHRGVRTLC